MEIRMNNEKKEQDLRIEKPITDAPWGEIDIQKYLTVRQAADFFKVSEKTIRRLYMSGLLPYYKLGRAIRFTRIDLDNYAFQRKVG